MGRRAAKVRYAGHDYPNTAWALGDVLLIEPRASDQRVAELLNVTPQTVQYHRDRAGIPPFNKRGSTPYQEKK